MAEVTGGRNRPPTWWPRWGRSPIGWAWSGVIEVDDTVEAAAPTWVFHADQEKVALSGVSVDQIARTPGAGARCCRLPARCGWRASGIR
ncbi:MAG: hypothetical protein U0790_05350 [Isosphaeraceae bacterium]